MAEQSDTQSPSSDPLALSIGDVAELAGRSASSIRYYEAIGLLPVPERVAGQRRYGREVLRLLAVIDAARAAGLSLAEIRDLLSAGRTGTPVGDHLRAVGARKLAELDALIEQLRSVRRWLEAASTCECLTLEECPLVKPNAPPVCA